MGSPARAARASRKIQGLPKHPRPIMAMSAPVCFKMRTASSPENTSPLAMTGMDTASLTSRMVVQSAVPPYICTRVRPWTAMADTPASSSIFARGTALTLPLSQPRRIFTVTGTGEDFTTASASRAAFSGSFIRAAPSPEETTLPTGQPMLMSSRSAPLASTAICAASAMQGISLPKIWAAKGRSPGKGRSSWRLFLS